MSPRLHVARVLGRTRESLYLVRCGCGWVSPEVNDRRSALQAHEQHATGR